MLEKLFEAIDEKVFTADIRESIEKQFNEAVEEKAKELAESLLEEKINEAVEAKRLEIEEEAAEKLAESLEAKNAEIEEYKSTIVKTLDDMMDRVVEEFVAENAEKFDDELKVARADMILEAVSASTIAAGVSVARIVEAKEKSEDECEAKEIKEAYDALVAENIAVKRENDQLLRAGVIMEMSKDMTVVESEKFKELASLVSLDDADAVNKLEKIVESVRGSVEGTEEQKMQESHKDGENSPSWKRFV